MTIQYLEREHKPKLAYVLSEGREDMPMVMFCGGYRSDMEGTKATWLEQQCQERGQGYIRFDYSGHGSSDGKFDDGTIGVWFEDALAILDQIVQGSVILVGSSMGGWIALLLAKARAERVRGLVGIAAAPDFTEELFGKLSSSMQERLLEKGFVAVPNDYSDEPYLYTKALYEDGKRHLLLNSMQNAEYPIRLVHGMRDLDVDSSVPEKVKEMYQADVEITYIEDGDHRLSRPQDLAAIDKAIQRLFLPLPG